MINVTINIRQTQVDNAKILYNTNYKERLKMLEAIFIQKKQHTLNTVFFYYGGRHFKMCLKFKMITLTVPKYLGTVKLYDF